MEQLFPLRPEKKNHFGHAALVFSHADKAEDPTVTRSAQLSPSFTSESEGSHEALRSQDPRERSLRWIDGSEDPEELIEAYEEEHRPYMYKTVAELIKLTIAADTVDTIADLLHEVNLRQNDDEHRRDMVDALQAIRDELEIKARLLRT